MQSGPPPTQAPSSFASALSRESGWHWVRYLRERVHSDGNERCMLALEVSPEFLRKISRVRALIAQSTGKPCSIERALEVAVDFFLDRKDPMAKKVRAVPPPFYCEGIDKKRRA